MKKISGFTLLELLAVISIAAILLSISLPSMQSFIKNNRLVSVHNELVSALQVARSGAIQKSGVACVCASSSAGNAAPVCDANDAWESGWIAFVETGAGCAFSATDNDVLLKAWDGAPYAGQITVRSDSGIVNGLDYIRFNSRGIPLSGTGAGLQGMFKVCDDRGLTDNGVVLGRGIVLSASGSLRMTKDTTQVVACL